MLTDKITFEKALELEQQGRITIFDTGDDTTYHSRAKEWQANYLQLRTKARHISPQYIPEHFNARYLIEKTTKINSYTYKWKYLRAIESTSIRNITKDDTEYYDSSGNLLKRENEYGAFYYDGTTNENLLKKETGKTAQEHIHLFVIEKAKNKLLSSKSSISEIGYSLGFEYPQHFSNLFKSKAGISPSEYRKSNYTA